MDIEFSKLTDLFIQKWEGTIIPKLKEIASLEKKNDIRHLLDAPLFGEVIHIIPQTERECALMFLRVLGVKYFDGHLFPSVSSEPKIDMSKLPGDLIDYRPLNIV